MCDKEETSCKAEINGTSVRASWNRHAIGKSEVGAVYIPEFPFGGLDSLDSTSGSFWIIWHTLGNPQWSYCVHIVRAPVLFQDHRQVSQALVEPSIRSRSSRDRVERTGVGEKPEMTALLHTYGPTERKASHPSPTN